MAFPPTLLLANARIPIPWVSARRYFYSLWKRSLTLCDAEFLRGLFSPTTYLPELHEDQRHGIGVVSATPVVIHMIGVVAEFAKSAVFPRVASKLRNRPTMVMVFSSQQLFRLGVFLLISTTLLGEGFGRAVHQQLSDFRLDEKESGSSITSRVRIIQSSPSSRMRRLLISTTIQVE